MWLLNGKRKTPCLHIAVYIDSLSLFMYNSLSYAFQTEIYRRTKYMIGFNIQAFESLEKKTRVQLEDPLLTKLHTTLVKEYINYSDKSSPVQ